MDATTLTLILEPLAPVLSTWCVARLSAWWQTRTLRARNSC